MKDVTSDRLRLLYVSFKLSKQESIRNIIKINCYDKKELRFEAIKEVSVYDEAECQGKMV